MHVYQLALSLVIGPWSAPLAPQSCDTQQVNLTHTGGQPVANSLSAALSADARTVAWATNSDDVVPGDLNVVRDVFARDVATGAVELVSLAWDGSQGDGVSENPSLSSDGNIVVFSSEATRLVPGPAALFRGVYVRDRAAGTIERIDVTPAGAECNSPGISEGQTSGSGRYIVFTSSCSDLVANDTNGFWDVFLRDRNTGVTEMISVAKAGGAGNFASSGASVTPDGRWVLFGSAATDLVNFDTNSQPDVFLRDRQEGITRRVSKPTGVWQANGASFPGGVSADGRWIAFLSGATNLAGTTSGLTHTYVRDVVAGTAVLVSVDPNGNEANASSTRSAISPDGRYVLFTSLASNLVPGDTNDTTDVFRRDLHTGTTELISATSSGTVPVAASYSWLSNSFSADGRSVLFLSEGPNLISPPDPNGRTDVFVRTCLPAEPESYCVAEVSSLGCTPAIGSTGSPSASAGSGFNIALVNTVSQKSGLFFYGLQGARLVPFQGGFGCVQPPVRRTPLRNSGGSAPPDCTGQFSIDFNAWIAGGADPALVAGQHVWGQWWSRDATSSFNTNLSDALALVVGP